MMANKSILQQIEDLIYEVMDSCQDNLAVESMGNQILDLLHDDAATPRVVMETFLNPDNPSRLELALGYFPSSDIVKERAPELHQIVVVFNDFLNSLTNHKQHNKEKHNE